MAQQRTGTVFISYRRQDSAWPARQLYEALAGRFGAQNIFKDVDDIEPGEDFVDKITAAVAQCDVLLALVGPQWLTMTDAKGRRRLDDPEDFVRIEIGAALARGVRVIPILIDGSPMPSADQLPADLAPMVRRQAVAIDPVSFNTERLFGTLADMFDSQRVARTAAQRAAEEAEAREAAEQAARQEAERASREEAERASREEAERASRKEAERASRQEADRASRAAAERTQGASSETPGTDAGVPGQVDGAHPSFRASARPPEPAADPRPTDAKLRAPDSTRHLAARRRTPVGVLVAAAVAVALLAGVLVWRPWQPSTVAGQVGPVTAPADTPSGSAGPSGSPSSGGVAALTGEEAVWAHRGGSEQHQFGTQQAMEAAARAGFGVEVDVRHTSDGVAVLVHDEEARKGLDCGGKDILVSKTTYAALQKTCRSKPTASDPNTYPVPRFDQTMEAIAAASPSAWVYAEMKENLSDDGVKKFLSVLIDNGLRGRAVVTAFSRDRLAQVRRIDPTMPTALLMMTKRQPAADLKGDDLWGVAVQKDIATKQYVQQLQANGSRVILWPLNDTTQWNTAKQLGADNVMTDFPAKYTEWRATQ